MKARMKNYRVKISAFIILIAGAAVAAEMELKPYIGSEPFQRIKKLAGTWEGTHKMGEETVSATATYTVTSNGSAVVEMLFVGSPHEMVTIYHDDGGKVSMTHYCSLANRPHMVLTESDDTKIAFEIEKNSDINTDKDQHMHGLVMSFPAPDRLVHNWTMYENGKNEGQTTIILSRKK